MILVFIPYHEQKRYCLNELFDWIRGADLKDTEIILRVHKGTFGEKDAVKKQREFARLEALRLNASHLLFVGADTIPPLDVLPRFLSHNLDVVGGVYYGRDQVRNGNPETAVAWIHNKPNFNKKENLSQLTGLVEVNGMGMDCVLFSRKALESFSFLDWIVNDDDYPAYDTLRREGFKIYLDTEIICNHISN